MARMPAVRARTGAAAGLAAALWLAAAPADGQVYLGGEVEPLSVLQLGELHGWSGLRVRRLSTRSGPYVLDESIFAPGLHLQTSGCIYHERLACFTAQGTGLLQSRSVDGPTGSSDDLTVSDFDLGLHLLREKPARLNLFAGRTNDWIVSPYAPSIQTVNDRRGAEARADLPGLPLTLTHTVDTTRERLTTGDREVTRSRWRLTATKTASGVRTALNLRHEGFRQNLQRQDFSTDGGVLTASYPGPGGLSLSADGRWLHRFGTRNQHQAGLGLSARRPLAPGLDGRAELRLQRLRNGAPGEPTAAGRWFACGLHHLLYGSLDTDLRLDLRSESSGPDGRTTSSLGERGADLNLRYHRRTARGDLGVGLRLDARRRDLMSESLTLTVSDEPHRLEGAFTARLDRPWVEASSVVVTDESGFLVYQEGLDYDLIESGPYTELRRRPEGEIPDGGGVLVDYSYEEARDAVLNLAGRGIDVRFDAAGPWAVWAGASRSAESLAAGDPGRPLWRQSRREAGGLVELGRIVVENEYAVENLTDLKLRSNRTRADCTLRPPGKWRAAVGASRTWTLVESQDRSQEYFQVHARARRNGRGGTALGLEVWATLDRTEQDQGYASQDRFGAQVTAARKLGALALDLRAAYHLADRSGYEDRRFQLEFLARRVF